MESVYRPYVDRETFRSAYINNNIDRSYAGAIKYDYIDDGDLEFGLGNLSQSRATAVAVTAGRFYARMVVAQPFQVVKFLLQVGEWDHEPQPLAEFASNYGESSSDEEEVDYFVDTSYKKPKPLPSSASRKKPHRTKVSRIGMEVVRLNSTSPDGPYPEAVRVPSAGVFDMISAITDHEGPLGLWRGMHASCLYQAACELLEAWFTGLITGAALSSSADPQFVDVLQSSSPLMSVAVSTMACALTCGILAPIAMIRARFIVTSYSTAYKEPRSLRYWLFNLRSFVAPISLLVPTMLSAAVTRFVRMSTPLLLFQQLDIDEFRNPRMWPLASLGASLIALIVKLPLETIANRAQVRVVHPAEQTFIVPPKEYRGIIPTLWSVARGHDPISSLYRGWRVEVLGTLGEWGYDALDGGKSNPEHF